MHTEGINPKITRMANQIAMFMESKPEAEGIEGLSSHINDFWEPGKSAALIQLDSIRPEPPPPGLQTGTQASASTCPAQSVMRPSISSPAAKGAASSRKRAWKTSPRIVTASASGPNSLRDSGYCAL